MDDYRNCQDAQQEALIAESEEPFTYESAERCRVELGRWTDPCTGEVVTGPGELDVDHVVPLANAHRSGAWEWDCDKKRSYANDLIHPEHLVAHLLAALDTAERPIGRGGDSPVCGAWV